MESWDHTFPILHRLVSACRRPHAVRGVPLRPGAGPQACRGYFESKQAAGWGRAAYRPSGAPPRVPWPSRGGGGGGGGVSPGPAGGVRGRRPPGRPPASRGLGGGRCGGGQGGGAPRCPPLVPRCCSLVAPGGQLLTGGGGNPL